MYNHFKEIALKIISKRVLLKIEPYLRFLYSINKKGSNHICNICHFKNTNWIILQNKDHLCPKCGSLSRDRRLYKIISENYLKKDLSILDFSPSRSLFRKWKKEKNINYTASDLSGDFIADVKFDITNINQIDNKYDLIICFHILEHVIDDLKAMKELYRVLNNEGTLIIQTPFKKGDIYEDYSIISKIERLKHFGQEDHVRIYSIEGLKDRLESIGFSIKVLNFRKDDYYGFLEDETILIAKK